MRWESNNFGVQNKKNHSIRAGKISEISENIPTYELGYFHRIRFEKNHMPHNLFHNPRQFLPVRTNEWPK